MKDNIIEQQRELRFQAILEAIPDDLMLVDGRGQIREYKAGRSENHIPIDGFLGTRLEELFSPEAASTLLHAVGEVLLNQQPKVLELRLQNRDFEARLVQLEPGVVLMLFRDVTTEREAERVKSEFIAAVSHELRTPLTSILGYTELLLGHGYTPEEHTEFLESIEHSTLRLKDMVNNLLDTSRLEAGSFSVYPHPVDLTYTLQQAGRSFAGVAKLAQASFVWELDPIPVVDADPERIAQVVGNLLSNALKFCPKGGTVWLRAKPKAGVLVEVEDTGPGISEEERGQLFNRYSRTNSAIRRGIAGTGLGLYISKAIIQAHNGQIWVESGVHHGAKFSFWLPMSGA